MDVEQATNRRRVEPLLAVALLSVLLAGCGSRVEQVEVTAPKHVAAPRPAATSTFQGAVAAVDQAAATMVVAVRIVWAPVLEARAHERPVFVDPLTSWDPGTGSIARVGVGDEVQVDAEDALDGTWRAVRVLLIDPD